MSATALSIALDALGEVPALDRIPTMDLMTARTRELALRHSDLIDVRTVGHSRAGEPIEMLSIGAGPLSALLIGAPHPNEPIGCMTIERLLQRLCESTALREALPFRWHCIKAIEPDALRLNEGWFDRPGDLTHYLDHFFRPALADQAEYGFPFDTSLDFPVETSPENDAWRTAFEIALPDLLYSLHNADYGGAFYMVTPPVPELVAALPALPPRFGLGLNDVGEPLSDSPALGPGVFVPFDPAVFAKLGKAAWQGGDSSAGYANRHGALSLIAEVSMWEDANSADRAPSPWSREDLERLRCQWSADIVRVGRPVLAQARPGGGVSHDLVLRTAQETLVRAEDLAMAGAPAGDGMTISNFEYRMQWVGLRLIMLRKIGLIRRLAISSPGKSSSAVDACENYLRDGVAELRGQVTLRAMPLRDLVGCQLHAGIAAAAHLAN
jgi:hypothetical protein